MSDLKLKQWQNSWWEEKTNLPCLKFRKNWQLSVSILLAIYKIIKDWFLWWKAKGKNRFSPAKALTDIYLWRESWEGWVFLTPLGLAVSGLSLFVLNFTSLLIPMLRVPCFPFERQALCLSRKAFRERALERKFQVSKGAERRFCLFPRDGRVRTQAPGPRGSQPYSTGKSFPLGSYNTLLTSCKRDKRQKNLQFSHRGGNQRLQGQCLQYLMVVLRIKLD